MSEIDNKLTDGFAERLCDLMQETRLAPTLSRKN